MVVISFFKIDRIFAWLFDPSCFGANNGALTLAFSACLSLIFSLINCIIQLIQIQTIFSVIKAVLTSIQAPSVSYGISVHINLRSSQSVAVASATP